MQPLQRFFAAPTHPTVPRRTAEGARLPARSAHPPPAPREHVAQTSTRKLLETKIMMTVHHTVPATHLIRPRQAHHHIPERKTLRSRLEKIRGAFHDHHGYHAASQKASTNTNHPESAEPSLPTNLAWDGRGGAVSRGKARGLHRFRCKECGRIFGALTGTARSELHLKERWRSCGASLAEGETIKESTARCRMAPGTVHRRHPRFLAAVRA